MSAVEHELALQRVSGRPCFLCDESETELVGMYAPSAEFEALYLGEGYGRRVYYALCNSCAARPDADDRVENAVRFHAAVEPGKFYR